MISRNIFSVRENFSFILHSVDDGKFLARRCYFSLDIIINTSFLLRFSGKTTQIPQIILEDFADAGTPCRIVCTQPRRISAITVAERVAKERGERLGESVGYQIRLEAQKPTSDSFILFCTVGIVLQWLSGDRNLQVNISIISS